MTKQYNTNDRRIRRTKKLLKDSLATLLLDKDLNDITIKEIVDLADINRGTFYLHYRDIHDMLSQIEAEMLSELEEISKRFPSALLKNSPKSYIHEMYEYVAENQIFCKMLLGPRGDMAFVEKLKRFLQDKCFNSLIETCPENELQRYKYIASYTVAGCIGLMQEWMGNGMKSSPTELSEVAEDIIQNGIDILQHKPSIPKDPAH